MHTATKANRWSRLLGWTGVAGVVAGMLGAGGCGLRLDILEPAPDGGAGHDAARDSSADGCAERASTAGRCEIPSLSCGITSGCPATWAEARLPSSCADNASIVLAECGGANGWTSYHEFTVLSCYYDPASGALQGFHQEADHLTFCGNSSSSRYVGNVPASCGSDGGVYTDGFSCSGDGGLEQPVPCGGVTCAPGQYCRIGGSFDQSCKPTNGDGAGACAPIPVGCGGVATCDCLSALAPGCSCCVPEGSGVFSCG